VLAICLVSCLLLVVNGALVAGFYGMLGGILPPILRGPKVTQLIMFIVPVVMILVEWRLVESLYRRLTNRRGT